jgi:hypothetical protein
MHNMCRLHVLVILVVLSLVAPVMLCIVPGTAMTNTEADCCRHMSAACDSPSMAECCSITVPEVAATVPASKVSTIHFPALDAVATLSDTLLDIRVVQQPARSFVASSSPPGFSLGFIEILRI